MTAEELQMEKLIKEQEIVDSSNTFSWDECFAQYLIKISKIVVQKFYRWLALFFDNFRKCVNQYGWDVQNKFKRITNADNNTERIFSEIMSPNLLPKLMEIYLQRYLPTHLPKFESYYALSIGKHFWDWLFEKGFTDLMIEELED